jgi:hypothetical protein
MTDKLIWGGLGNLRFLQVKKNKTFVLAGWKAGDLPKHDIWPIFRDNGKNQ